ncbi:hypothetical protein DOY81_001238 [Sarcophaga bullata]|nr:hypothetical protein DOY81_001238 [Sarcophaga bullata]
MSEELNKILLKRTLKNKKIIKPLVWISLTVGCNLTRITGFRDPIKLINLTLILLAFLGLFGQYYFIWENRCKPLVVYTDALCTSFQTWISISKLLHFFFTQQKFQQLLHSAKTAEILQDFEILELNILNKKKLIQEIEEILNDSWLDIRRQLNFYTVSVFGIGQLIPLFVSSTAFQSSFPIWRDKGLQFPYYFVLYIVSGSDLHICGLGKKGTLGTLCFPLVGAVSFAGFFIVTSLHGLALVKILRKLLAYTTSENVLPEERVKFLLGCCKFYQRIYDYCDAINTLYYVQSAPLFLVSTMVMCLLLFQASVGLGNDFNLVFKMFLYFSAAGFEVSMYCVNGQRLTAESEHLPVALYDNKWYDECAEFKFITRMMLMRTNRSIALQVGGFTTMSFVTLLALFTETNLREIFDPQAIY